MKCFNCKEGIKNESKAILLSSDGDFVCDEECQKDYNLKKDSFFRNIGNDDWYEANYFPLSK
jgi:hypothetical protein